jgi:hypothetical protein
MKIRKIAQDEATKPITGPTNTSEILNSIKPIFEKSISSWYIADGSVGWFLYKDGNEYEVVVTPAKYGKYKNLREQENYNSNLDEAEKKIKEQLDSGLITPEQYKARMQELKG